MNKNTDPPISQNGEKKVSPPPPTAKGTLTYQPLLYSNPVKLSIDNFKNIPEELKKMCNWCNWQYQKRKGQKKLTKIPYHPETGKPAKSNDPSTWSSFEQVIETLAKGYYDGIGFFFTPPYFGVDIDHMDDMEQGQNILEEFQSSLQTYCEYSPSGKGIHLICKGALPKGGNRKGLFEMYQVTYDKQGALKGGRYFTMTGNAIGEFPIVDCSQSIEALHTKYITPSTKPKGKSTDAKKDALLQLPIQTEPYLIQENSHSKESFLSDGEILEKACNCRGGDKFAALYQGQWQSYFPSQSEADLSFCTSLSFWTQKDIAQMDRLFRTSGLMRDKWNRPTGNSTYGLMTLETAIQLCTSTYSRTQVRESPPQERGNTQVIGTTELVASQPIQPIQPFIEKRKNIDIEMIQTILPYLDIQKIGFNLIAQKIQIDTENEERKILDFLVNDIKSTLGHYKIKGNTADTIQRLLTQLAYRNRFNPFLDTLQENNWDQQNRYPELFQILGIQEPLSQNLMKKWLRQVISLQYNSLSHSFGGDGCLVLVGEQGIGKSSFFRQLLSVKYFPQGLFGGEKYLNFKDKDTEIRNNRFLITELSEIETTMRGDLERLKGFITTEIDCIRLPYGRSDVECPRLTSYCGTCNSEKFLRDSQNRRFWTIPVSRINLRQLNDFDSLQLWKQVAQEVQRDGLQSFRLSKEEQFQLQIRNQAHREELKGEREVLDILENTPREAWKFKTVTEFKESYSSLKSLTSKDIGLILKKLKENFELQFKPKGRLWELP